MRREKLNYLVTTGRIVGKHSRRNHQENILFRLTNSVGRVTDGLNATKDGDT